MKIGYKIEQKTRTFIRGKILCSDYSKKREQKTSIFQKKIKSFCFSLNVLQSHLLQIAMNSLHF